MSVFYIMGVFFFVCCFYQNNKINLVIYLNIVRLCDLYINKFFFILYIYINFNV